MRQKIQLFAALLLLQGSSSSVERCGIPGVPANGSFRKTNDSNTIEYYCMDRWEYRLIGSDKRRCEASGLWDPYIPWCEPNAFYKMADIRFQGADLMNRILWERLRNKTGTVTEIGPEGIDILLEKPTTIREIALTPTRKLNTAKDRVTLTMTNGTTDQGFNCTLQDQLLTNSEPQTLIFDCAAQSAELISIVTSGRRVKLSHVGFYGDPSVASEVCGTPDSPPNGRATGEGGTAFYECKPGFQLVGNDTVTCKGRQWRGQTPTCVFLSPVMDHEPGSQVNSRGPVEFHDWMPVLVAGLLLELLVVLVILLLLVICAILTVHFSRAKQPSTEYYQV